MCQCEHPNLSKTVLELQKSWWGKVLMIWSLTWLNKWAMERLIKFFLNSRKAINQNLTCYQNPITFKSAKQKGSLMPSRKNIWRQKPMIKSKAKKECQSLRIAKWSKVSMRAQKTRINNRPSISPKVIIETLIAKIIFWSTKASTMKMRNPERQSRSVQRQTEIWKDINFQENKKEKWRTKLSKIS